MNLTKQKFPCKCGHYAKLHESIEAPIWEQWCVGEDSDYEYLRCQCSKYVPDNLKYLEEIYQHKNGNK